MSYLRSYHINLALGPSEHIVPFAVFTICPQVVHVFFFFFFLSYEFLFEDIRLLNIKVEGV